MNAATKNKIKDWFIVTRIRILNFIKEHKVISAVIGVVLLSAVVAIVVNAASNDQISIDSYTLKTLNSEQAESTDNAKFYSFDTITYSLSNIAFQSTSDEGSKVVIEAESEGDADVSWYHGDEESEIEYLDGKKHKAKYTFYNVTTAGSATLHVYLHVNNVKEGTPVRIKLTANGNETTSEIAVTNTEIKTLTPKVVSGKAYKDDNFTNGRYAPFGIMLGFDTGVANPTRKDLKGLYFDTSTELSLEAVQKVTGSSLTNQIELEENNSYFGLYDASKDLFDIPNYIYNENSSKMVYNSGTIESFGRKQDYSSEENDSKTSPELYLVGPKEIKLKANETYEEYGVATSKHGEAICIRDTQACSKVILHNGDVVTDMSAGETYEIEYSYNNNEVILKRTVIVEEAGEESIPTNPEESEETQTPSENTEGEQTSNLERIPVSRVTANEIFISPAASYTPSIEVGGKLLECNSDNKCEVKYTDSSNKELNELPASKPGDYTAHYTYTDSNGFKISLSNTIHIQLKYTLKIKDISTDDIYYSTNKGFVVLGSYFVTAKSIRENGEQSNINVTLKVNGVESSLTNYNVAEGTKTNSLSLYDSSDNKKIDDYLAYGEEVVLRSKFTYSKDGDNKIGTLKTKIPVAQATSTSVNPGTPFTMINYYSNVEDMGTIPHNIKINGVTVDDIKDNKPISINSNENSDEMKETAISDVDSLVIKYLACEMSGAQTTCSNYNTYNSYTELKSAQEENSNLQLAYIEYTATNVAPGTTIDFRTRLITNVANNGGNVTLTSSSNFDSKSVSSNISADITIFKARTTVAVDNNEYDISVDGANVHHSTISISPSVSLPAQLVNTNAAGVSGLNNITVIVNLPKGINYSYNDEYMTPVLSNNKKTLTYTIKNKDLNVNDFLEAILIDVYYDVDIESGSILPINVLIQATASDGVTQDKSSQEKRTTIRNVTYLNSEKLAYGQYVMYSGIAKDTPFTITSRVYNNSKEAMSNLDLITILPYNDVSNEKNQFNGSYTLSKIPDNAFCTTQEGSIINNVENLKADGVINWSNCSNYSSNGYAGVTAIKVKISSLDFHKTYSQEITINPVGNIAGDVYAIKAHLLHGQDAYDLKEVNVTVVSKKITGVVWEDFNEDGIINEDEEKLEGISFNLYNVENDNLVATTTSDKNGVYTFSGLDVGKYYVMPEFDSNKYTVAPYQVDSDKSITSQFKTIANSDNLGQEEDKDELDDNTSSNLEKDESLEENEFDDDETELGEDADDKEEETKPVILAKSEEIEITDDTRSINNINLGLNLRKVYSVKVRKYVTKAITTNALGITTTTEYGNATLAKLNVKDISNLSIKVVYTIELENIGYYPGYIYNVKDYVPDGMIFNPEYSENSGWIMDENGYVYNETLANELVYGGEKRYLTIAFDITRKEAGSFVNYASVDDEDLQILIRASYDGGDGNE